MASVTYGKCIMANVIMAKIFMAKILWQMKLSQKNDNIFHIIDYKTVLRVIWYDSSSL